MMSRINRSRNWDECPEPPKKTIYFTSRKRQKRRVNTEVHDALSTFGLVDRTSRLSEAEMYCQFAREGKYLLDKSAYHLRSAFRSLKKIFS